MLEINRETAEAGSTSDTFGARPAIARPGLGSAVAFVTWAAGSDRQRTAPIAPLLLVCALAGCSRPAGSAGDAGQTEDAGVGADAGLAIDSGYDPVAGNRFLGALILDDERVRALDARLLRAGPSACRAPVLARVYRVVDGDTIRVRGETAVLDASVRMIGVDTPEVARPPSPADCYGPEAASFTGQLLNRLVWLTFDAECFDRFDRVLAYVHVGAGEGDLWECQLLRRGLATVMTIGSDRTFAASFEADEAAAGAADVGLWSACF